MPYVLVNPSDEVVKEEELIGADVATKSGWRWLPLENFGVPSYSPKTQYPEGPSFEVFEDIVKKVWTIKDKTQEQISAEELSVINSQHHLLINALCDLENRIRSLEGQSSVSLDEYKNMLRTFL